jgi:hypothetical protein
MKSKFGLISRLKTQNFTSTLSAMNAAVRAEADVPAQESQDWQNAYLDALPQPVVFSRPASSRFVSIAAPLRHLKSLSQLHSSDVADVCAVILLINPVRMIQTKRGDIVEMCSFMLGDPTKAWFRLTAWGTKTNWLQTVKTGDIVVINRIVIRY